MSLLLVLQMFNVLANLKITDGTQQDSITATADTTRTTTAAAPERPPPPRTKEQQQESDKDEQEPSWGTSVAGVSCVCVLHSL